MTMLQPTRHRAGQLLCAPGCHWDKGAAHVLEAGSEEACAWTVASSTNAAGALGWSCS